MNLMKNFFITIYLLSQINASQAMNLGNQLIQVPTKEQIKQIHETYSFYNKLSAAPVLAVAGYWLYRNNFKCVKREECSSDYTILWASIATVPVLFGCTIRKKFLDFRYEECVFRPLRIAIEKDDAQAVDEITTADSVNMRSPISGITPLRLATLEQKEKIVKMLLDKKAHREDEAVFDAMKTKNVTLLKLLLSSGCKAHAKLRVEPHGHQYALNFAIRSQLPLCAQALLEAGAHQYRNFTDMNADGSAGHNAYELAEIYRMENLVNNYKPS